MLYYDEEKSGVTLTIGKDAGYYHQNCPNLLWNEDRQPYGYAGVRRLFEALRQVMSGEQVLTGSQIQLGKQLVSEVKVAEIHGQSTDRFEADCIISERNRQEANKEKKEQEAKSCVD